MSTRRTQQTMYMHTLDRQPAMFDPRLDGGYMVFAGGSTVAPLVATLRQIRREQRQAIATCARLGGNQTAWANPRRYGYVRVALPPEPSR